MAAWAATEFARLPVEAQATVSNPNSLAFEIAGIEVNWMLAFEKLEDRIAYLYGTDKALVKIDPKFYRPAEVQSLCGDSLPIRQELGWEPRTDFKRMIFRMVWYDICNKK